MKKHLTSLALSVAAMALFPLSGFAGSQPSTAINQHGIVAVARNPHQPPPTPPKPTPTRRHSTPWEPSPTV